MTIVTPSYNQAQFLEETIVSILEQDYPNLEYIVIDGGSKDGSIDILKKYERHLSYWQSEKDNGQTDALMQGFARSSGDILNWINSDDLLAPGALRHVANMADENPDADIYASAVENFVNSGLSVGRKTYAPKNLTLESILFVSGKQINRHQPGIFFRREIYERIGGFKENYKICMDLDLHARMLEHGAKVVYSDRTTARFRCHQGSKTQGNVVKNTVIAVQEYIKICNEIGKKVGIVPNHKPHLRTLSIAIWHGLRKMDFRSCIEAANTMAKISMGRAT